MIDILSKYYYTLRYLKPIQIRYQLKYKIFGFRSPRTRVDTSFRPQIAEWNGILFNKSSYQDGIFQFLNLTQEFSDTIDWNFLKLGKLWCYNLNYFDYLNAQNISQEVGLELIQSYIQKYESVRDGKEPYPTSLRIGNWIKFLSQHNIYDEDIHNILIRDTNRLKNNLEYHLLANHLLENAFALLFSSYYFRDRPLYVQASSLLKQELDEQILHDGAHYELSPMYHQLMLSKVLDGIHLIQQNPWIDDDLHDLMISKAKIMLSWISQITFASGNIPLVNDAAYNVNPSTSELIYYAEHLNIDFRIIPLKESGYRMFRNSSYEVFCDVANVSPDYQPGHTHADTFNYIIYIDNLPFIVDSGTATYEISDRRIHERSTKAHNTIVIGHKNSSVTWSGFRVAQRAKVTLIKEEPNWLIASHDGYQPFVHTREWVFQKDKILIVDSISSKVEAKAYIHFHPKIHVEKISDNLIEANMVRIQFENTILLNLIEYEYAEEFNKIVPGQAMEIVFNGKLTTKILLN